MKKFKTFMTESVSDSQIQSIMDIIAINPNVKITNSQIQSIIQLNNSQAQGNVFNYYQTSANRLKIQLRGSNDYEYTLTMGKRGKIFD